jgi:hypothetical protein
MLKEQIDIDAANGDSMTDGKKIPGDRLVLATISVLRTLIAELSKKGIIDPAEFVKVVQETAIAHRLAGDPDNLADAIHALSIHLQSSVPDPDD